MKRYIVIEIDEDWHDNAAMDEVQALPCTSHFWAPMSAAEVCDALKEEAENEGA